MDQYAAGNTKAPLQCSRRTSCGLTSRATDYTDSTDMSRFRVGRFVSIRVNLWLSSGLARLLSTSNGC
jgi:hypothetical protein